MKYRQLIDSLHSLELVAVAVRLERRPSRCRFSPAFRRWRIWSSGSAASM